MTDQELAALAGEVELARLRQRRVNLHLVALRQEFDVATADFTGKQKSLADAVAALDITAKAKAASDASATYQTARLAAEQKEKESANDKAKKL